VRRIEMRRKKNRAIKTVFHQVVEMLNVDSAEKVGGDG